MSLKIRGERSNLAHHSNYSMALDYWIKNSPSLDRRWGGFYRLALRIYALQDQWRMPKQQFENELVKSDTPLLLLWGSGVDRYLMTIGTSTRVAMKRRAIQIIQTRLRTAYENINVMVARLVPDDAVVNRGSDMLEFLLSKDYLGHVNYFLGGNINEVGIVDTSVRPSLRSGTWSLLIPGVCYNHHNPTEPDWRNLSVVPITFDLYHSQKNYE